MSDHPPTPEAFVEPSKFWGPQTEPEFVLDLRQFLREHVLPEAARIDREDIYPLELVRMFASAGYTRSILPVEYGGHGDYRKTIALFEELGYVSTAFAVSIITIFQVQTILQLFGTSALKDLYMPKIAQGMPVSYSLTEAAHGSDIRRLETKAVRDQTGWIINGEKSFITSGDGAEFFVILAETEMGVSAFALPYGLAGCEKYVGNLSSTMGLRNGPHVNMRLSNVRVPLDHLIGTEGKGVRQAIMTMSHSRTCTAAICLGIARAAFDGALHRAGGRVAFDQTVLSHQGIQWYFAEMFADIEAARLLTYRAADALNSSDEVDRYSSVAKLRSCQIATEVALRAMQICGAYGTSDGTPFARYLRDAKTYEIGAGSSEIMKNTIAKYIIREAGK